MTERSQSFRAASRNSLSRTSPLHTRSRSNLKSPLDNTKSFAQADPAPSPRSPSSSRLFESATRPIQVVLRVCEPPRTNPGVHHSTSGTSLRRTAPTLTSSSSSRNIVRKKGDGGLTIVVSDGASIAVSEKGSLSLTQRAKFRFDRIFEASARVTQMYRQTIERTVTYCVGSCKSVAIVGYGADRCGKEALMFGNKLESGVAQHAIDTVFRVLADLGVTATVAIRQFAITQGPSGEVVWDLLDDSPTRLESTEHSDIPTLKAVGADSRQAATVVVSDAMQRLRSIFSPPDSKTSFDSSFQFREGHVVCEVHVHTGSETFRVSLIDLSEVSEYLHDFEEFLSSMRDGPDARPQPSGLLLRALTEDSMEHLFVIAAISEATDIDSASRVLGAAAQLKRTGNIPAFSNPCNYAGKVWEQMSLRLASGDSDAERSEPSYLRKTESFNARRKASSNAPVFARPSSPIAATLAPNSPTASNPEIAREEFAAPKSSSITSLPTPTPTPATATERGTLQAEQFGIEQYRTVSAETSESDMTGVPVVVNNSRFGDAPEQYQSADNGDNDKENSLNESFDSGSGLPRTEDPGTLPSGASSVLEAAPQHETEDSRFETSGRDSAESGQDKDPVTPVLQRLLTSGLAVPPKIREVSKLSEAYEIGEQLGRSGVSVVRWAKDKQTGEEVALKVILTRKLKLHHAAIEREILTLAKMSHPRLVAFREVITTPNNFVVAMELVTGASLYDHIICRKRLSEFVAHGVLLQILEAVEAMHAARLMHHDLKPENILVVGKLPANEDTPLSIKLSGFGLVTELGEKRLVSGTAEYTSPEGLSRAPCGPESDIWSVGVILYVMLSGIKPFFGATPVEVIKRVRQGTFTFPKSIWDTIAPAAKDLISSMLEVDPSQRITIANIRSHPWVLTVTPPPLTSPKQIGAKPRLFENLFENRRRKRVANGLSQTPQLVLSGTEQNQEEAREVKLGRKSLGGRASDITAGEPKKPSRKSLGGLFSKKAPTNS